MMGSVTLYLRGLIPSLSARERTPVFQYNQVPAQPGNAEIPCSEIFRFNFCQRVALLAMSALCDWRFDQSLIPFRGILELSSAPHSLPILAAYKNAART